MRGESSGDDVEARLGKRELFRASPNELRVPQAGGLKEATGLREHGVDRVGEDDVGYARGEREGRVAGAGADVEQALLTGRCRVLDDQLELAAGLMLAGGVGLRGLFPASRPAHSISLRRRCPGPA